MDNISRFIQSLGEKKDLIKWCEKLSSDASVVVLAWTGDENGECRNGDYKYVYKTAGAITMAEANYMVDLFKKYLLDRLQENT